MADLMQKARAELAVANHILFDQGVLDGFGHVSMRHPVDADRFLLSRSLAPGLVRADDILVLDLDSTVVEGSAGSYLERFIHGEIYRARPEVMAVVHSHAPATLPFSMVPGIRLCPVCHMSGFLCDAAPVYEIRDHAGTKSDLLIRSRDLGATLARTLAGHAVVLMRGHGMTVVGGSLRQAVFRAIYTEVNARVQSAALAMGTPTVLSVDEAEAADAVNSSQVDRAWDFWALKARLNTTIAAGQGPAPAPG